MITLLNCGLFSLGKSATRGNQDSIMPPKIAGGGYIMAVADGVGAYDGALEASQMAIKHLSNSVIGDDLNIGEMLSVIKKDISKLSESNANFRRAATTLTFCYINKNSLYIGHIGDTRIYARKGRKLVQLSTDHTQHQELINEGLFTKKELKGMKGKNTLTSALSKVIDLKYQETHYSLSEIVDADGALDLYIMSDGAHYFWEKRPRFSDNTLRNPVRFASSLQKRIEKATPIDDYSLVAASFKIS
ncbi:PP2C family protein-serine/threonine phosphatase [Xenorhabdus ehlersii]|uniref:Serine/threonine protein phosphatase PrpC n=1 Tax=Xenorhabdus ehlersii TaxID=290111 RepID=A0A2D0IKH9_9GAMM|nr:protein phosphatase 2C domain-containing protein [Xenorhabdus ehlersii]PHM22281.1 serine/threonine protein phosphatase family protein [Xenorhabdus ehlersii]RKE87853.1 serine/threonine protein phosphatase PrpC [Xenorhabdus ehlersii]